MQVLGRIFYTVIKNVSRFKIAATIYWNAFGLLL